MIGSAVAYLVAEQVAPGSLYDRLLERNGIHLKKEPPSGGLLAQLRAGSPRCLVSKVAADTILLENEG